jgi:nitronate monooxygenase
MKRAYHTEFTKMFDIDLPIIGAPMFLVSNVAMVKTITEAGGIGTFPALNFRPLEVYDSTLAEIQRTTNGPFGVNIIVNKSNTRQTDDLRLALDHGASFFITSLGNPKHVIADAHKSGAKVFCDVTNVEHAKKVQDLGADGVIAVASGAGGHAGPISPFVLIPWLKRELEIPIVAAGGVANGATLAACLALGASAASIGTRFIASTEAGVDQAYKQAVVDSSPEDIVMTTRVSGTPAAVINTDFVKKMGTDLPYVIKVLKSNPLTKKYVVPLIHLAGMRALQNAAEKPTWKTVWSAGQSVGLVHEISSCEKIVNDIADELFATMKTMRQAEEHS